jgi:hypothetical protein
MKTSLAMFVLASSILFVSELDAFGDAEPKIRAAVARWQNGLLRADLEAVMATISVEYRGQDRGDRADLREFLHHAIAGGHLTGLAIELHQAAVRVNDGRAHVFPVQLKLAGATAPLRLELVLIEEDDVWRIVSLVEAQQQQPPEPAGRLQTGAEGVSLKLRSLERRFVRAPGDSPRPEVGAEHVPLRTSFYMLIGSTEQGDQVLADQVAITLEPEDGDVIEVLRLGQQFGPGYSGELTRHRHRSFGETLLVFVDSTNELAPDTTYTIRVRARSRTGATLGADEGVWSFNTEAAPTTHRLSYRWDVQAEPDVRWKGQFFNGFAKPSFATSTRDGGRVPHYRMMAEARKTYPRAWNLLRDAYLAGFEYQYNPFKAYPNLVRERETRRITAMDARDNGVLLTVEDFFGHQQYGIPSDRPLSIDYKPGDQILVADGIQSTRGTVTAVDDRAGTVLLDEFDQPDQPWQLEYPRPLPTIEDPHSPGLFPPGGTYLRKFDPPGTAHYYWGRVHHEWDLLVKQFGFRVIPRFAGAPGDLSIDGRGGTTAKCLVQLHEVTREITSHLIQRYGRATLDWPWVVLNEPDLMSVYWRNRDWEELQRFYDYTSDAILRAFEDHGYESNQVQVGGLELGAIAGLNMRLEAFLTHVSPNATGEGALEKNAAFADPRLAGRRSRRVETLCEAHDGRGAPFDFLSIHTYNDSELAAAKLIRAKEVALEIDPEYFETLAIVNHETVPQWQGIADPGAAEMYLGNGYFPTWAANIVGRLLQRAAQDPRYAYGGENPLMGWPGIRQNWSTLNDVVRQIRVEDRHEVVASPIFHFVNLLSTLQDDFRVFAPRQIGGHSVAGFASTTEDDLRLVLVSHHGQDPQSRSEIAFEIDLELIGLPWEKIEVEQYRIDRDHNSYYRLARELREPLGHSRDQVHSEEQFQRVVEQSTLRASTHSAHTVPDTGSVTLTAPLAGNGINFVIVRPIGDEGPAKQ